RGVRLERDQLEILNLRGFAASHEILVPKILDRIRERGQPYSAILLDPTYKLHAPGADENSAVDVGALMNSIDTLAVEAGAGVGFSAHYSKGNQANKEVIDRVSGSGVFARDPDTIINFTAHQQETAYVVEAVLRNFPPVPPFVVRWQFPRMVRESTLDPADLKNKKGGCNQIHDPQEVLDALPEAGLRSCEWEKASGKTNSTFKRSKTLLVAAGLVAKEKGIWKKVQGPEGPKGPIGPSGP
ncbi:MAG: hypothetical protein NT154_13475, partial [Verrucomicrobia bacterium]|nr:hypothetical protein [Verrucomicrobiota bacterium]